MRVCLARHRCDTALVFISDVPNSGRGLVNLESRKQWDKSFRSYLGKLDAKKPVVVAGDFNVSHLEIGMRIDLIRLPDSCHNTQEHQ